MTFNRLATIATFALATVANRLSVNFDVLQEPRKLLVTSLMPESRKGLSETANMSSEWTLDERVVARKHKRNRLCCIVGEATVRSAQFKGARRGLASATHIFVFNAPAIATSCRSATPLGCR
jgi:hypothetical protein